MSMCLPPNLHGFYFALTHGHEAQCSSHPLLSMTVIALSVDIHQVLVTLGWTEGE